MAIGKLAIYNLGSLGVNVDKSPLHLSEGELISAQNAIREPLGLEGGLRKRAGLTHHNANAGAGSFIGGIGLPLFLEVNTINGVTLAGGPTRSMYWGRVKRDSGALDLTEGWWKSTNGFTTPATEIVAGTPANPRGGAGGGGTNMLTLGTWNTGAPSAAVVVKNRMYYADSNYVNGTTNPSIRVFDGVFDEEFVRIPNTPTGTHPTGIATMITVGGVIYLTVADSQTTGRVFSLDPSSGVLVQLGAQFTTSKVPYSLAWHNNRLWVGTTSQAGAGLIYFFRPGIDTVWTLSRTMGIGIGVSSLASFQGQLFAGARGGGSTSGVEVMSSLGVWSNSLNGGDNSDAQGLIVFKNNLYMSFFTDVGNVGTIRKFNGSAWSIVLSGVSAKQAPLPSSWVDQGTLYFGGGGDTYAAVLVSSTDGAVWTDKTANLPMTGFPGNLAALSSFGILET